MNKLLIEIGNVKIPIKTRKNKTARKIIESIPLSGDAHKWGKEFYFYIPLNIQPEIDAKDVIKKGEIAYWPKGNAIAIAYGPTPISKNNEIRLADKCSIWADTTFNLDKLDDIEIIDKTIRVFYA
tara:strand:+ start:105 stop:479 length:375 start_codon:yes stop_codon:yes gene_type:complete